MKKTVKSNGLGNDLDAVGLQHEATGKLPGGCTGRGFRKGQSGNPSGGRKNRISLRAIAQRVLTPEMGRKVLLAAYDAALKGDVKCARLICELLGDIGSAAQLNMNMQVTTPTVAPSNVTIIIPDNGRGPSKAIDVSPTLARVLPPAPKPVAPLLAPAPAPAPHLDDTGGEEEPEPVSEPHLRPEEDPSSPAYIPSCFRRNPPPMR